MLVKFDHITNIDSSPCQIWVKRVSGSLFPILINSAMVDEFLSAWGEGGAPEWFEYDPETNLVMFTDLASLSFEFGVEDGPE